VAIEHAERGHHAKKSSIGAITTRHWQSAPRKASPGGRAHFRGDGYPDSTQLDGVCTNIRIF
jgi:hypothetical protein